MPNIEIHASRKDQVTFARRAVVNALKSAEYAKDVVITAHMTDPVDLSGNACPFLCVALTAENAKKHLKDLMTRLYDVPYDIELLELKKFIPHKG